MNVLKKLLMGIGVVCVLMVAYVALRFGGSLSRFDDGALPAYMAMAGKVLETGDPAKGMIKKKMLNIPKGMRKEEAIEGLIEAMDEVADAHGLAVVDNKIMNRKPYIQIRAYCSKTIGQKFIGFSPEFIGFMPCRMGIAEDKNGDVYVYTMSLDLMINGGHTLPKEMLVLANEVRAAMNGMLDAAESWDE